MDIFHEIEERLRKYSNIQYDRADSSITVFPSSENGFEVWLTHADKEYTVFLEGWHQHFDTAEEALECFVFGLSDQCRIKIKSKGSFPYHWCIQSLHNGHWIDGGYTASLFFPFWKKTNISYRQNKHISKNT